MAPAQTIPSRHPQVPVAVPTGVELVARAVRISGPSDAEFTRLGEALGEGDPIMDDLVDHMLDRGMTTMRPMFERALAEGVDAVDDATDEMRAFFARMEATPSWVDHDMLRRASLAMCGSGVDGMYIARDVSLVGGYTFSGFNQTLLRTGALQKGSNARFAETAQWALDVTAPGGLDARGAGYRSTLRVRLIHSLVRRHVLAMDDWDCAAYGLPINQTDMAATLVGSLVAPAVGGLAMGLIHTPAEYAAIAHLTRYVGWLMGVDDEFAPVDFRDAVRILHHTSAALAVPDDTSPLLARPMADDPLTWTYPRLTRIRRRIARSQHLSIGTYFLGRRTMAVLGLPTSTPPWYPILRTPINLVHSGTRLFPGGRVRTAARGHRAQRAFVATMEPSPVTIGDTTRLAQTA